jgi:hypothetical protein
MSTHLVIDTIIYYFRDTSYISGINDIFPEVILISSNLAQISVGRFSQSDKMVIAAAAVRL